METWEIHIGPKYLARVDENQMIPPLPGEKPRRFIALWDKLHQRRVELAPFEGDPDWTTAPAGSTVLVTEQDGCIVSIKLLESSGQGGETNGPDQ